MAFVLDSSVALAWLLPDEKSESTDFLADRLEQDSALVPPIWPLEIGNALLTAQRRGRIKAADVDQLLAGLIALPIELDRDGKDLLFAILKFAASLDLTAYDAAYLELAQRRALPLATLDARLRKACMAVGIVVLP